MQKQIQLLQALVKHRPQLLNAFASNRRLHLSALRSKWLTAEEAKRVAEIPVGSRGGHPEDPDKNTNDVPYMGSPEKGDVIPHGNIFYRNPGDMPTQYLDRVFTKIITSFIWFWVFYHLYYDYAMLTGHFYLPYTEEFTDEELGIPPDSADDPEYWGNHSLPYGSYR
ncbi:hypothetical protein M3Y97_00502000 [Aphelenchoides bicaudatus]|nr:hypothetical protein M3Y97_00502000 [Aphelenchoides bicaudatus]